MLSRLSKHTIWILNFGHDLHKRTRNQANWDVQVLKCLSYDLTNVLILCSEMTFGAEQHTDNPIQSKKYFWQRISVPHNILNEHIGEHIVLNVIQPQSRLIIIVQLLIFCFDTIAGEMKNSWTRTKKGDQLDKHSQSCLCMTSKKQSKTSCHSFPTNIYINTLICMEAFVTQLLLHVPLYKESVWLSGRIQLL